MKYQPERADYVVGAEFYLSHYDRYRKEHRGHTIRITKVGRLYAYAEHLTYSHYSHKISLEDNHETVEFGSGGTVYTSQEAFEQWLEAVQMFRNFSEDIQALDRRRNKIPTPEQIEEVRRVLGMGAHKA